MSLQVIKAAVSIFILGLSFGWGPCLVSCGPLLISYVAGTKKSVFKSISSYLLFSLARVLAYLALGLLVFFLGKFVFEKFGSLFRVILLSAGLIIILIGVLVSLGKSWEVFPCLFLRRHLLEQDKKSVFIFGLVTGLMPCGPLIVVFTYTGLISKNLLQNIGYISFFGLGTVISPLAALVVFAALIPKFLESKKQVYLNIFNIICGLIIIFLGAQVIRRGL